MVLATATSNEDEAAKELKLRPLVSSVVVGLVVALVAPRARAADQAPITPLPPLPAEAATSSAPAPSATTTASSAPPQPVAPSTAMAGVAAAEPPPPHAHCRPCDGCNACDKNECNACDRKPWERTSVFGVRGSYLSVKGPENAHTFGVTFAGNAEEYKTEGLLAMRGASAFLLGGGSGGLEGQLGGSIAIGVRAPLGATHGPVARAGLGGELLGNSKFYFSHLDLPIVEVGYEYMLGRTVVEVGGRGAPVLTGRYNTGDAQKRELGTSFEWGPYAALHADFGRIDATFTRIEARSTEPKTPVDVLRTTACVYLADVAALCGDVAYFHGDQMPPPAGAVIAPVSGPVTPVGDLGATSVYGGVMIGLLGF